MALHALHCADGPGARGSLPSSSMLARVAGKTVEGTAWLARFHAGDRTVLEDCYREHFLTVTHAVGQVLRGADRETVVHEVFLQLISNQELRQGFQGGALASWLATVARNRALDYWRRYRRETSLDETAPEVAGGTSGDQLATDLDARRLVDRFRHEALPPKWANVFEVRFLGGLPQREAARRLGISRTTLAYRELKVRRLLQRFLRRQGEAR